MQMSDVKLPDLQLLRDAPQGFVVLELRGQTMACFLVQQDKGRILIWTRDVLFHGENKTRIVMRDRILKKYDGSWIETNGDSGKMNCFVFGEAHQPKQLEEKVIVPDTTLTESDLIAQFLL